MVGSVLGGRGFVKNGFGAVDDEARLSLKGGGAVSFFSSLTSSLHSFFSSSTLSIYDNDGELKD